MRNKDTTRDIVRKYDAAIEAYYEACRHVEQTSGIPRNLSKSERTKFVFRDKTSCDMGSHGNQVKSRKISFSRYNEINSASRHVGLNYLDPIHGSKCIPV